MTVARGVVAALVVALGVAAGFAVGRATGDETRTVAELTPTTVVSPAPGLPAEVDRTRRQILDAAERRDYEALEAIIGDQPFRYTFGENEPGGAVAYWRQLEESGDEQPLETLAAVLRMPYTLVDGIYVWPFAYDVEPARLGPYERRLLEPIAGPEQIASWEQFGAYIGYRAGIAPDGRWQYYLAGD